MTNFIPDLTHVDKPTGSRYRRVEVGRLPFPYKCTGCGSSDRACADFDFQLSDPRIQRGRIGAVLLCELCFRNVADVMGYISQAESDLRVDEAIKNTSIKDSNIVAGNLLLEARAFSKELQERANEYSATVDNILAGNFDPWNKPEVVVAVEPKESSGSKQPVLETASGSGSDNFDGESTGVESGIKGDPLTGIEDAGFDTRIDVPEIPVGSSPESSNFKGSSGISTNASGNSKSESDTESDAFGL